MRKFALAVCWLLLLAIQVSAQDKTISGRITDAKDGSPVAGVTINGKGTTIFAQSGPDGTFRISLPQTVRALIFSSVGYGSAEVNIGTRTELNVSLSTDGKNLDEVVVVAYGTQRKKEMTGAAATVKGKDIANQPRASVDQLLQGKVAGLQSITPSGQPGSIQQLRLRGIGSITAGAAPLWVIDGVPVNTGDFTRVTATSNALAGLNPNDIEEITVLKDASATSIYGSRAANGVILVTTKKGKIGKARIRVDTELGYSDIANLPDKARPLNAAEWLELTREGLVNSGATQTTIDNTMAGYGATSGVDVNWFDLLTRRGEQQQVNVSISGGNERTTYYVSGGMFKQEAPVIASDFKRWSGTLNLSNKVNDRLTISTTLNGSTANQNTPSAGGAFANPFYGIYLLRPTQNPYNPDGTYNISRTGNMNFPAGGFNMLYLAENDKKLLTNLKVLGSLTGEYKILDNLKFTTRYGVDYLTLEENRYDNPFHGDGRTASGRTFFYYTKIFNWVWTNQLDYRQYLFGKESDIYVDAKIGYEAQKSRQSQVDTRKDGFPPTTDLRVAGVAATPVTIDGGGTDYTFNSIISSAAFNYKNKYVLNGSFRRDASSRFGINNRSGNFWSVGAAWNIEQENFMQSLDFVSAAKLRVSYGVNGNGDVANYGWRPLFTYGFNYNGQPGGTFNNIGNTDLTWELNKPFDLGIDLSLFRNRINLTVDYYKRVTSDLLLNRPLSRTTGFTTILQNVGAMENKGVEVTLDVVAVSSRNFTWNVGFNYARNKNRITSLPNGDFLDGQFYRKIGADYQSFYGRQYAGVDVQTGDPLWYVDAAKSATTKTYTAAERIILGSATPKYFGSLNNTLTFKEFSLDFQLYYNFGNLVRDQWSFYNIDGVDGTQNKYAVNLERWRKPGDITNVPKYVYGLQNNASSFSTRFLYKGDFIRLRNITLSYKLPKLITDKLRMTSGMFYVRGFNLWTKTFDDNLTIDPEAGVNSVENLTIPINKTITAGVNLEF